MRHASGACRMCLSRACESACRCVGLTHRRQTRAYAHATDVHATGVGLKGASGLQGTASTSWVGKNFWQPQVLVACLANWWHHFGPAKSCQDKPSWYRSPYHLSIILRRRATTPYCNYIHFLISAHGSHMGGAGRVTAHTGSLALSTQAIKCQERMRSTWEHISSSYTPSQKSPTADAKGEPVTLVHPAVRLARQPAATWRPLQRSTSRRRPRRTPRDSATVASSPAADARAAKAAAAHCPAGYCPPAAAGRGPAAARRRRRSAAPRPGTGYG